MPAIVNHKGILPRTTMRDSLKAMKLTRLELDESTGGRPPAREALVAVAVKLPLSQHRELLRVCARLGCRPSDVLRTALTQMLLDAESLEG